MVEGLAPRRRRFESVKLIAWECGPSGPSGPAPANAAGTVNSTNESVPPPLVSISMAELLPQGVEASATPPLSRALRQVDDIFAVQKTGSMQSNVNANARVVESAQPRTKSKLLSSLQAKWDQEKGGRKR